MIAMARPLRILIVEGNTATRNAQIRAQGGRPYAEIHDTVIAELAPAIRCSTVRPCEDTVLDIRNRIDLAAFDGVVWTGSSLHAYDGTPEAHRQIDLFGEIFETGLPILGSCWGLQVMTVALGGIVRRNPKGREIGIARDILLTDIGVAHPMFRGKPARFDSIAMHLDEVESLPRGGLVLAGNAASSVQAVVLERDERCFWGTQYHPEFDLQALALGMQRAAGDLIREGFFPSASALDTAYRSFLEIHANPAACSIFGIDESVLDPARRHLEIGNWLTFVAGRATALGGMGT
jgi:GMP synthase (glutamine-hydrolysing)